MTCWRLGVRADLYGSIDTLLPPVPTSVAGFHD